jgi:F-type H+-transporting ATPase subunit a
MKRLVGVIILSAMLGTGAAFASDHEGAAVGAAEHGAHQAAGHEESKSSQTAHHILHHVADSEEFELEIPVPPYHAFTVPIASWFGFLKIEREPGACSKPTAAGLESVPGVSSWMDGCWDLRPTKAILMMWTATALLFLVLFIGRKRDANGVPKGLLAHLVEVLVLYVRDEIVVPNIGKAEAARYTPYIASLFFFVLSMNWLGLIPGMFAATGVLAVTTALAVLTFGLTQVAGIRSAGLKAYLGHLTGGVPAYLWVIMVPVEVLGLFTKPFALLVRLFANMLGGHMMVFFLLGLIFMWTAGAVAISLPVTIAIYCLEIFVGLLQAYLFALLTSLFIGQGVAMGHHAHAEHEHPEHAH